MTAPEPPVEVDVHRLEALERATAHAVEVLPLEYPPVQGRLT